jgi:metal-responsive CopG/Arc/MetJ family transcriptional regulator
MPRLNLTLDTDTFTRLDRHARRQGARRAGLARRILREALDAREALERRKKLAAAYTAGRTDARELMDQLEVAQLEWFDEED